jgi:hypothetical protein
VALRGLGGISFVELIRGLELVVEEMVEHLPCGTFYKEIYTYLDWVEKYMTYMDTL